MFRSLKEHLYGGTQFRPAPVILDRPDVLTVFTVWGPPSEGLEGDLRNSEPGQGETLAGFLNRLHHQLRETYQQQVGLEALILRRDGASLVEWCACGQPALFLAQDDKAVLLHQSLDFNFDSSFSPMMAPLPSALLGADEEMPHLSSGLFQMAPDQKIVLLSRSWIPAHALSSLTDEDGCIAALADDAAEMPFWWGLFEPDL